MKQWFNIFFVTLSVIIVGCGDTSSTNSQSSTEGSSQYNNNSKNGDFTLILDVDKITVSTDWKEASKLVGIDLTMVQDANYGHFTIKDNILSYKKRDDRNSTDIGLFRVKLDNNRSTDIKVTVKTLYWKDAKCGGHHTIALKSNSTLWSWGYNSNGELGDGTTIDHLSLVQEATKSHDWKKIDAGAWSNVAIKKDGTLWAWGHNDLGQVGDGTTDDVLIPKKISSDTDWIDISIRDTHVLALKSNGTLWSWGQSLGTTSDSLVLSPIQIDGKWKKISTGEKFSVAIKDNGTIYSWGDNTLGALGLGDKIDRATPTAIVSKDNLFYDSLFIDISAGDNHVLAIQENGTVWGWGNNGFGQLTDNSDGTDEELSPIKINLGEIKYLSLGAEYSMGIYNNGTLKGWGDSQYGTIGADTWSVTVKNPIQESTHLQNWILVDAGVVHTVAITKNGELWIWGTNEYGEIGDGTTNSTAVPLHIYGRKFQ